MKILITGCNGQLGRAIERVNANRHQLLLTDVESLDITETVAIEEVFKSFRPEVIINCAAFTDVEKAEDFSDMAYRLNAEAPAILADTAKRFGGIFIHISTDYVFGDSGINRPLKETDSTAPVSVYGETKLKGEERVREILPASSIIIRTSWLYSPRGKNFVRTMKKLVSEKVSVNVVEDQIGSPTSAIDLAKAILTLVERPDFEKLAGTYHFSNRGVCSWYDFAVAIAALTPGRKAAVLPCTTAEFPTKARRPAYSVMDKSKIARLLPYPIPHWEESLKEIIQEI